MLADCWHMVGQVACSQTYSAAPTWRWHMAQVKGSTRRFLCARRFCCRSTAGPPACETTPPRTEHTQGSVLIADRGLR